jgi:DMSO/TMAO reductase YedYZ molybdopterin-dependent catalytic subunit
MKKPGAWMGALIGILVTAPLAALYYTGDRLAGLPFAPFDVFDWLARVLPGGVVTFGIDTLVRILLAFDLDVAQTAKSAEHILAIGLMLLIGALIGAVAFTLWGRRESKPAPRSSARILGLITGIPMLLISLSVNRTATTDWLTSAIWIIFTLIAWATVIVYAYDKLYDASAAASVAGSPSLQRISRREFLIRLGAATAAITVVGAGLALVLQGRFRAGSVARDVPQADPIPPATPDTIADLQPARGTRAEYTPVDEHYRIDINTRPPLIDGETWALSISGLVGRTLRLTLDDLRERYEPMHQFVTLSCISNIVGGDLIGTTRWTGVSLQKVLADARVDARGRYLFITSIDGFYEVIGLDQIAADERIMLAYAWDGQPLTAAHGFPLRVFIPDRYGMKQPKWIVDMRVVENAQPGYWVARGWDREAIVKHTSVIDTVALDAITADNRVPIGGIAYAGARGIMKVEVRVDEGKWQEAQLRTPLSDLTWVVWRYDWPFESGAHTFYVRCFDGDGIPQTTEVAEPRPDGASGIFMVTERL